jgi:hypothetical protein
MQQALLLSHLQCMRYLLLNRFASIYLHLHELSDLQYSKYGCVRTVCSQIKINYLRQNTFPRLYV